MNSYINNIIPRLKQFSEDLSKKEFFVDTPWVIVDNEKNHQKYIFRRSGDLLMSLNGKVTNGKWEYLSSAKSLLIDRGVDKLLLNQAFLDPAVMVLKQDGDLKGGLILANESLIPDFDVERYLKTLYLQKNRISEGVLTNDETLEIYQYDGYLAGNVVAIDGNKVPDGILELKTSKRKLVIQNSKISKVLIRTEFQTDKGIINVEHEKDISLKNGDYVFVSENEYVQDGKYRLTFLSNIIVKAGRIIKKSFF